MKNKSNVPDKLSYLPLPPKKQMVFKKTWEEFRKNKLLWWVNRTLHLFGWAIVFEFNDDGKITEVYPARVKFRGFDEHNEELGFAGLTDYLKKEINDLSIEVYS